MVFQPPSGRYSKSLFTRWSGRFDVPSSASFTTLFVFPVAPVTPTALAVPDRPAPNAAAAVRPARSLVRNPIPLILIN